MQSSGAFLLHFHPIHGMLEPEEKWKTGEGATMKRIGMLLALLAVLLLPCGAAEKETSGSCGVNTSWRLEDGVLTISGTGEMHNYIDQAPWADSRDEITALVLEPGVTNLGDEAMRECENLQWVSIGPDVTKLGERAFRGCTSLQEITIPDTVTEIDGGCFMDCTALSRVTLPEGLTTISYFCFQECSSLTEIALPKSLKTIEDAAFEGAGLTEVILPDTVTQVGLDAFAGTPVVYARLSAGCEQWNETFINCMELQSVEIPEGVKTLDGVFQECSALETVTLPEGVTSISGCFVNCTALREVTLPESIQYISDGDFSNCQSLTELTLPEGLIGIGDWEFNGSGIQRLHLPASLVDVDADTFFGMQLSSLTVSEDNPYYWMDGDFLMRRKEEDTILCYALRAEGTVELPEDTTVIGKGVFVDRKNLQEIILPEQLKTIEMMAFSGCTALETVKWNAALEEIGDHAFFTCRGLKEAILPERLRTLGRSAFEGSGVETVSLPEGLTAISDACFYGCDKLKNVELPETMETIGSIAFHYCTALEEIMLPDSVRRISNDAFSQCTSLNDISLPEALQELDKTALQNCGGLERVEFRGSQAQWQALTEAWDEESVEAVPVEYGYALPEITIAPDFQSEAAEQQPKDHSKFILLGVVLGVVACLMLLGWCIEKSRKRRER